MGCCKSKHDQESTNGKEEGLNVVVHQSRPGNDLHPRLYFGVSHERVIGVPRIKTAEPSSDCSTSPSNESLRTIGSSVPNDECSEKYSLLTEAIGELYNINNEEELYTEPRDLRDCQLQLAEPEASDPEETEREAADKNYLELSVELVNELQIQALPIDTMMDPDELPTVFPVAENVRKRKFTFHNVCGKNIKFLGSDTVAFRSKGYDNAIAVISKPLKRGESCWFTIEKIDSKYSGTLSIGALPYLPIDPLPPKALDLPPPSWILASDYILNKRFVASKDGRELNNLFEGQTISVRFEQNGDVVIELDAQNGLDRNPKTLAVLGFVKEYSEIYPLIDLYGKIVQVSVNIYPHLMVNYDYLTRDITDYDSMINPSIIKAFVKKGKCCLGANPSLMYCLPPIPKPMEMIDMAMQLGVQPLCMSENPEERVIRQDLHRYTQFGDNFLEKAWKRALLNIAKEDVEGEGGNVEDELLDSQLITALTLEATDLPDLDDQGSSTEISSVRTQTIMCTENLNYIKRILSASHEGAASSSLESEWEAAAGCELLPTVLRYWKCLSILYPELSNAVSWGQVKCFCSTCQPTITAFSGWVKIERIDGVEAASKSYYNLTKFVLGATHTAAAKKARPLRPITLRKTPSISSPMFDLWVDDGNLLLIHLAIEIDTEGSQPKNDKLLGILLYVRPPAPADDASET